jgi:transcriptional regulator with XRE-family HTH domain
MSSFESFPIALKAYRKSNGLTQEELARQLNYSVETISAWERGKRKPHPLQISRLAHLLGMDAQELNQHFYPSLLSIEEFKSDVPNNAHLQQNSLITIFSSQNECQRLISQESRHATSTWRLK